MDETDAKGNKVKKEYAKIAASSESDNESLNEIRKEIGWKKDANGDTLIPIENIKEYIVLKKQHEHGSSKPIENTTETEQVAETENP